MYPADSGSVSRGWGAHVNQPAWMKKQVQPSVRFGPTRMPGNRQVWENQQQTDMDVVMDVECGHGVNKTLPGEHFVIIEGLLRQQLIVLWQMLLAVIIRQ